MLLLTACPCLPVLTLKAKRARAGAVSRALRRRMSQTQPDLGGARDESSSRPFGHGGVNTPGTHLVTSHLASLPEPEGRLRHSQPWLCRDLALIGERALLGVKGPHRSEIRNPNRDVEVSASYL